MVSAYNRVQFAFFGCLRDVVAELVQYGRVVRAGFLRLLALAVGGVSFVLLLGLLGKTVVVIVKIVVFIFAGKLHRGQFSAIFCPLFRSVHVYAL